MSYERFRWHIFHLRLKFSIGSMNLAPNSSYTLLHWYDIPSQMNKGNAEQFGAICLLLAFISCETWCKNGKLFFSLEQCKSLWLYSLVFFSCSAQCTISIPGESITFFFHSTQFVSACVCNRQQYFIICASACRCVTFKL